MTDHDRTVRANPGTAAALEGIAATGPDGTAVAAPDGTAAGSRDAAAVAGPGDTAAALHRTLLRVAGWAPDDLVTECRRRLAAGGHGGVARTLAFCGIHTLLPLTDEDLALLGRLLAEDGVEDGSVLDIVELIDVGAPPLWRFAPEPPTGGGGAPPMPAATATDAVAAVAGEPSALGLWRAWRSPMGDAPYPPPRPVYVVETDGSADLPALTGRLQRALAAGGEVSPQVEVVVAGADPLPYHRFARDRGGPLWSARPAPDIRVARVFDLVDPTTGPGFAPDRPGLTDDDRKRALAYLKGGTDLLVTMGRADDVVDPDRGTVVPLSFRTDGTWIWTDAVTYYAEVHGISPDADLLRHIRAAQGPPPEVDAETLSRATQVLTSPPDGSRTS
ncbi:hypothetical protein [Saccharothrix australiensis]|uniref:Uncharacterized protein n=1 Tax=Saccharothrix australiensis TaxID=2072 RepID=A0A495WAC5_9PSEU|nr:hypothetical protein [Saccharothrix australiensis]RKT56748.1 hypothetical protein C8E97_5458 [Saccharothrix australiensis]